MEKLKTWPDFTGLNLETAVADLLLILDKNRAEIAALLAQTTPYTWDNLMAPMEALDEQLHAFWSVISHLNAVTHSEALRAVYEQCLGHLSDYQTDLSHNDTLYQAIASLKSNQLIFNALTLAQKAVIDHELRDFKLAGVALSKKDQHQFSTHTKRLSELGSTFSNHVLDATQAWSYYTDDQEQLSGLPQSTQDAAHVEAQLKNQEGWLLTLEAPVYIAVMTYADSRTLREKFYQAYATRASDQGPNAGRWDNSPIIDDVLSHRHKVAQLLGFDHYLDLSLATKMAATPDEVEDFLQTLLTAALPKAILELEALSEFAKSHLNLTDLQVWDVAYASEKLRQEKYAFSQEALRPYFSAPAVIKGLFGVVEKLWGLSIVEKKDSPSWHDDVQCFAVSDSGGALKSFFYLDLYARKNKRGGAWMDDCRSRRQLATGEHETPIALITCNFTAPIASEPALLTHEEVVTLFHEFGHALQHMMTTVDTVGVAGINGIPWDAVELASQCLENWAYEKESLQIFAQHYVTGECMPDDLFEKMQRARYFQSALQMVRQLEFALFDFHLHRDYKPNQPGLVQAQLDHIRSQTAVIPVPDYNRFQNGFSHIFAGGYAAGYYSYLWAEVMASDAFALFKANGVFDKETAQAYLACILEPGGSEAPAVLFERFRGRAPSTEALLKQVGIV